MTGARDRAYLFPRRSRIRSGSVLERIVGDWPLSDRSPGDRGADLGMARKWGRGQIRCLKYVDALESLGGLV